MRGQSEREGEGVLQRAQMSEGKWVSGARGSKWARTCGGGRRPRGRGRVHGEEIVSERLGMADRWGPAPPPPPQNGADSVAEPPKLF
jgi:hypothetical protein